MIPIVCHTRANKGAAPSLEAVRGREATWLRLPTVFPNPKGLRLAITTFLVIHFVFQNVGDQCSLRITPHYSSSAARKLCFNPCERPSDRLQHLLKLSLMVKRIKSNPMETICQLTSCFPSLFALLTESKVNWHSVDDGQTQLFKLVRRYRGVFGCGPRRENLPTIRPCKDGGQIGRTGRKMGSKVCFITITISWWSAVQMSWLSRPPGRANTTKDEHLRPHLIKHDGSVVADV